MKYVVGNHHFSRGILVDDSGLIPPNILEIENPSFGASLCCFSRENVVFMVLKLWAFPCCPNSRTSHASDQSVSDRQAVLFVFPQLNQDISSDRAHSLAQGCTKRCRHHPHGPHIFFWQDGKSLQYASAELRDDKEPGLYDAVLWEFFSVQQTKQDESSLWQRSVVF